MLAVRASAIGATPCRGLPLGNGRQAIFFHKTARFIPCGWLVAVKLGLCIVTGNM